MNNKFTIVYRANAEDAKQFRVIEDSDVKSLCDALAAFQATDPDALLLAVIAHEVLIEPLDRLLAQSNNIITVTHGDGDEFKICAVTGNVLTPESEMHEDFKEYKRADITEYLQWASDSGLFRPASINALGLRWIHKSGYVEEAEIDWRNDLLDAHGLPPTSWTSTTTAENL